MFRAFVVDDEQSVLEGMKIMIPWNELDFELCGDSSNTRDALAKIKKLRPHLIITDIRMPQKDGLELIKEVRGLDMDAEFVILSGYPDFSYAQEAMKHQVSYYLLKPIDKDEMTSVLQNIRRKLDDMFLAGYGFSQAEIEAFKRSLLERASSRSVEKSCKGGDLAWKSVSDTFDDEFDAAVKLMNGQKARELVDELFEFFQSCGASPENACFTVNSYVYHILRIAYERNIKLHAVLPAERNMKWDFAELKEYITDILDKTIRLMLEDRRKNSMGSLYDVKAYIENNFDKELSVSFLAGKFFFEAGYLGEAFSKQFGCSINEYQHRLRIEKAIELIRSTGMKLSEISAFVGYNNYNNFFSHFERITRKKPTQYIRKPAGGHDRNAASFPRR